MNQIHYSRASETFTRSVICSVVLVFAFAASALGQSQDAWETGSSRKLGVPDSSGRKCVEINKNGIYTGKLSAAGKAVSVEQYSAAGVFVRNWTATFTDVGGLASDSDGNVYVFDQGASKVFVFDGQGTQLRAFGSPGTGDGQLSVSSAYMVGGIAVDALKNVYVADQGNSRVQVFDSAGLFKLKFGSKGNLPDQFLNGPAAVAVMPNGVLIAYDHADNWYHLRKFTLDGKILARSAASGTTNNVESGWNVGNRGYGGHLAFAVSPDGLLLVGSEGQAGGNLNWGTPGKSYLWDTGSMSAVSALYFGSYGATRGAAFDPAGNVWMVRGTGVECLYRRMRFGAHVPSKAIAQPVVTKVSQAAGSKIVDIDYRVTDPDSSTVTTALVAFNDGVQSWEKMVIPKTFTGSIGGELGSGVSSGGNHRVSWNAAVDMAGKNFASLSFVALAKDDRPEIGVHYVSIPPDALNSAALKISHKPVQEDDLKDLWIWLLGKGDSRVAISGNTVILTDAGKSYVAGAPLPLSGTAVANVVHNGTTTTTQGRAFAYKLINCRPVTADEKTRASAGRFNLESVSDNSVVSLAP